MVNIKIKLMKIVLTSLLLCFATFIFGQTLNPFGHIITTKTESVTTKNKKGLDYIKYKGLELQGNSFYPAKKYIATTESACGSIPTALRLFDVNGVEMFMRRYPQIINLQIANNEQYLQFLSKGKWVVLNTLTQEEQIIDSAYPISINNEGEIIYFRESDLTVVYGSLQIPIDLRPLDIKVTDNSEAYIFGKEQYLIIDQTGAFQKHQYSRGHFFQSKLINQTIHWVEKQIEGNYFKFELFQRKNDQIISLEQQQYNFKKNRKNVVHKASIRKNKESIVSPLNPDMPDFPFRIGNSYAEYQNYGGFPYLHPGVDFLSEIGQKVYAPRDGVVKAILTTSGDLHWRIALGNEDTAEEQEGYLFAHLVPSTIPFARGEKVKAGDYLGRLVEWPVANFHHLHFARIKHSGTIWNGTWLTVDNVLEDISNFSDTSVPVFENLWSGKTIAFKSPFSTTVLEENDLQGQFDIICHVHDKSNDDWKVDVSSLRFEVLEFESQRVVYEQFAFDYGFTLDVYDDNSQSRDILDIIYSSNSPWKTQGDYSRREFYQRVSRSNGDGVIDQTDKTTYFDSRNFPDGRYIIKIYATDAVGNESSTEIGVQFNNNVTTSTDDLAASKITIYPNPSKGQFSVIANDIDIDFYELYDLQGKKIAIQQATGKEVNFEVKVAGIYLLKGYSKDKDQSFSQKVVIGE